MEKDRDFQSPKKKRRKVDLPVEKRFASAVSDGDMAVTSKGYVPPNTKKKHRLGFELLLRMPMCKEECRRGPTALSRGSSGKTRGQPSELLDISLCS